MRIIRFSAPEKLGVGTDPLFGVLNDQDNHKKTKKEKLQKQ